MTSPKLAALQIVPSRGVTNTRQLLRKGFARYKRTLKKNPDLHFAFNLYIMTGEIDNNGDGLKAALMALDILEWNVRHYVKDKKINILGNL